MKENIEQLLIEAIKNAASSEPTVLKEAFSSSLLTKYKFGEYLKQVVKKMGRGYSDVILKTFGVPLNKITDSDMYEIPLVENPMGSVKKYLKNPDYVVLLCMRRLDDRTMAIEGVIPSHVTKVSELNRYLTNRLARASKNLPSLIGLCDAVLVFRRKQAIIKYGTTTGIKNQRSDARKGATALMTPEEFKKQNLARYKEITIKRAVEDDLTKKALNALGTLYKHLELAIKNNKQSQIGFGGGSILIGMDPKGREIGAQQHTWATKTLLEKLDYYTQAVNSKSKAKADEDDYYGQAVTRAAAKLLDTIKRINTMDYYGY